MAGKGTWHQVRGHVMGSLPNQGLGAHDGPRPHLGHPPS